MVSCRFLSRISQQNQSIDCSATLRVFCVSSFKARVAFLTRFHGTSGTSLMPDLWHVIISFTSPWKPTLSILARKFSIECIDEVEARGTISHSQRRSFLHAKFIQIHPSSFPFPTRETLHVSQVQLPLFLLLVWNIFLLFPSYCEFHDPSWRTQLVHSLMRAIPAAWIRGGTSKGHSDEVKRNDARSGMAYFGLYIYSV
jgi:hypothetical protein